MEAGVTRATKRLHRGSVAGLAALATVGGALMATAGTAGATSTATATRIAGTDRYDTAAQLAAKAFPSGATNVILASGAAAHFADALAGNYLAGQLGAPILLTSSTGSIPTKTMDEITALKPTTIYILGDSNAVPTAQETALTGAGYTVKRLSGATRYDTDKAIVENGGAAGVGTIGGTPTAIVASGANFPDALAAGALAYADKLPVILTDPKALSAQAKAAITDLGIGQVIIAGSTASVSTADETAITGAGATTLFRAAGTDRSDTSRLLANWEISNAGFATTSFNVASGDQTLGGADALAGGPLAGSTKTPLLVTNTATAAGAVTAFAAANSATISGFNIFGGTPSVSATVASGLTTTVQAPPATNSLQVSPSTTTLLDIATDTTGDRQYTVSGLDNTKTYTVALLPTGDISGTGSGTTFVDANSDNKADDLGTAAATNIANLTVINGAVAGNTGLDTATPVNGVITFTVRGVAIGAVTPIVFVDANSDSALNLTAPATANANPKSSSEVYGLGGSTAWKDAAAAIGTYDVNPPAAGPAQQAIIPTIDTTNKFIDDGSESFVWDSNDVFQYLGVDITQAQFESGISNADEVVISYNPVASGKSTYDITFAPEYAPSITTAAAKGATSNNVTITVMPAGTSAVAGTTDPAGTTYQLLRASVATSTTASAGATFAAVPGATKTVNADGSITFTDNNPLAGNYYYQVQATFPVSGDKVQSASSPASGSPVVIAGASTATTPKSTYAAETTSAGLAGTLDSGDVITVAFDQALNAVAAGNIVEVKDADGTIVNLVNGTNATFALNAAATTVNGVSQAIDTVLTITLTATPSGAQLVQAGTVAGLQYPATVIDESGIANAAGGWNIASSSDVKIEQ